jgi:RimJ/RimL family protein N-acetyltransferase
MNDHELMRIRADTDFTYDARGRMVCSNEPCAAARQPAPRLFLGRTLAGHVLRVGATVPDDVARRLAAIAERLPPPTDLRIPPAVLAALREELARQAPITAEGGGPVFRFPATSPRQSEVVRLTVANRELVRGSYRWLYDEFVDWQPCLAVVRDGAAVSVCYSARRGPLAAEAGVDTLAAFRGRGLASAVVAAWGAAIHESDRVPLYSTGWDNLASQGVAQRLGLILLGTDATWA